MCRAWRITGRIMPRIYPKNACDFNDWFSLLDHRSYMCSNALTCIINDLRRQQPGQHARSCSILHPAPYKRTVSTKANTMANPIGKLSARTIAQFIKSGNRWKGDGGNLWLYAPDSGQYWIFRWTDPDTGKNRNISLGPLHTISLERARELARRPASYCYSARTLKPIAKSSATMPQSPLEELQAVTQVAGGLVPPGTSDLPASPGTSDLPASPGTSGLPKDYWETFIAKKSLGYRRSTYIELRDYVHSKIGDVPIRKDDRPMILRCIEGDWAKKYSTVARARRHMERIFEFAITKGYYRGENPALWKRLKPALAPKEDVYQKKHFDELPFRDVGGFLKKLRAHRFHPGLARELSALQSGNKDWGIRNRLLTLLKDGQSRTFKELCDSAAFPSRASGASVLTKLVHDGIVERLGRALYRGLPAASIDEYLGQRRHHIIQMSGVR